MARETAVLTVMRLDADAPEQVEVYVDDGTPVAAEELSRHLGAGSGDGVPVTRAELVDMIATATAAAVVAAQDGKTGPAQARAAALAAITMTEGRTG